MAISIKLDVETAHVSMEESIRKTEDVVLSFQKELIFEIVTKQFSDQYIKKQRRINAIKSPFTKARGILQEILGENIEKMETEEYIDMIPVDVEKKNTKKILTNLSYKESIKYLLDAKKHGLKKINTNKGS